MPIIFGPRRGVFKAAKTNRDRRGPRTARTIIFTIVAFISFGIWIGATTTVPEVTRASGELVPEGGYRQVQSAESGVVFDVQVAEGQFVETGQELAVLTSASVSDAKQDTEEELRGIQTELRNLRALVQAVSRREGDHAQIIRDLMDNNLSYAASRYEILVAEQNTQRGVIENLIETQGAQEVARSIAQARADARNSGLNRKKTLHAKGLITLRELDEHQDTLDQLRAAVADLDVRLSQTRKDLTAAKSALDRGLLDRRERLVSDIFRLEKSRDALIVRLNGLNRRSEDLVVRAPEPGVIHQVAFPNVGELIAAGDTIFEILPTSTNLIAQIEFDPIDIGHVRTGDTVVLNFETFDVRRYGQVGGRITSISPNSVLDTETSREFFRATVALDRATIGSGVWERNLSAGMVATAEVVTAERTAIAYLAKPVSRSFSRAFAER